MITFSCIQLFVVAGPWPGNKNKKKTRMLTPPSGSLSCGADVVSEIVTRRALGRIIQPIPRPNGLQIYQTLSVARLGCPHSVENAQVRGELLAALAIKPEVLPFFTFGFRLVSYGTRTTLDSLAARLAHLPRQKKKSVQTKILLGGDQVISQFLWDSFGI